jgi:hypothetical protein
MQTRAALLARLEGYLPQARDALEASHVLKTIDFVRRTPHAFERQHVTLGHVGASAVVVHAATQQILLTQHTVLHQLSFFGNHCDGCEDLVQVALERVRQDADAAIAAACRWRADWLDVDVHYVPPHQRRNGEDVPAHLHYDLALLFFVDAARPVNATTRWVKINEACQQIKADSQFQRILGKLAVL